MTTIRLYGEFDLDCEESFQAELESALYAWTKTLIIDLRGLRFMDSTGLRMLVQIYNHAEQDGLDFTILCGDGEVRHVLSATGLDGILPLVDPAGAVPDSDSPV